MSSETVGSYRLDELLGRGGMGEVYRAFDTAQNRVVALKLLRPQLSADDEFRRRFRRESEIAATLRDPHVIPIHRYGDIDGRLFLDMRLVDGAHLGAVLEHGGPMPAERAVRIVEQIAAALDAAHAEGLVHRDVKPSNALVTPTDFVYLVDFGLAKAVGATTSLTMTGSTLGTPAYMAPEQFGEGWPDKLVDVYALTCVLFEALTGRRPFPEREFVPLANAHLHSPPPAPSAHSPQLAAFDPVIARGMAKDRGLRFSSAGALAAAARAALAGPDRPAAAPVGHAPAHPTPNRAGGTGARRAAAVAVAVAAVAALVVAASTMLSPGPGPSPTPAAAGVPAKSTAPPAAPGQSTLDGVKPVVLAAPTFDSTGARPSPLPGTSELQIVSQQANAITDVEAWLAANGLSTPLTPAEQAPADVPRAFHGGALTGVIDQGETTLLLYNGTGTDGASREPTVLIGLDTATRSVRYAFDFAEYVRAPDVLPEDAEFVDQYLRWAQQVGDVLYVSHGHYTYARASKGENAYITAVDLTTGTALWHSPALVANAATFEVIGDEILTGYGFTAEDDYLYLLDRATGAAVRRLPVVSGPELILRKDDDLYVRCYDTDYVLRLAAP